VACEQVGPAMCAMRICHPEGMFGHYIFCLHTRLWGFDCRSRLATTCCSNAGQLYSNGGAIKVSAEQHPVDLVPDPRDDLSQFANNILAF